MIPNRFGFIVAVAFCLLLGTGIPGRSFAAEEEVSKEVKALSAKHNLDKDLDGAVEKVTEGMKSFEKFLGRYQQDGKDNDYQDAEEGLDKAIKAVGKVIDVLRTLRQKVQDKADVELVNKEIEESCEALGGLKMLKSAVLPLNKAIVAAKKKEKKEEKEEKEEK